MEEEKKLGKLQREAYGFVKRHPNEWHSYSQDSTTKRTISSLKKRKLLTTNEFNQMRRDENGGGKVSHHPKQKLNYVRGMGFNETVIRRLG